MKKASAITFLFVDIGGVLLTDGWGCDARNRAVTHFKLEAAEMEDRHHLTWNTFREGKLTLEQYMSRVAFYKKQPFTRPQFRRDAANEGVNSAAARGDAVRVIRTVEERMIAKMVCLIIPAQFGKLSHGNQYTDA